MKGRHSSADVTAPVTASTNGSHAGLAAYNEGVPTRVCSFCKINLGLAVGPLRPDGFHSLTTAYQTLALHDLVTVQARRASATRITLEADHPGVPCTAAGNAQRNTAYKMAAGALQHLDLRAEVHIVLKKLLPVQGGLGAGSANAAAALLALEHELQAALPGPERLALAAEVGSDVPLFLLGGTVLGVGRGETVFPLPDAAPLPVVVAMPRVGVSTARAFQDLDAQMASRANVPGAPHLTQASPADRLEQLSRVLASVWTPTGAGRVPTGIVNSPPSSPAGDWSLPSRKTFGNQRSGARAILQGSQGDLAENPLLALVHTGVENDFEEVAFQQHPSLRDIKHALRGEKPGSSDNGASEALYAALSGSGSALFGVYGSAEAAREAQRRVQSLGVRALLTETLPRREYWHRMFA